MLLFSCSRPAELGADQAKFEKSNPSLRLTRTDLTSPSEAIDSIHQGKIPRSLATGKRT